MTFFSHLKRFFLTLIPIHRPDSTARNSQCARVSPFTVRFDSAFPCSSNIGSRIIEGAPGREGATH